MGGCFAENKHMVIFWKHPGKRACNIFLECMLERICDVWKRYKYNPTDSGQHCVVSVLLATLCGSSFVMTS